MNGQSFNKDKDIYRKSVNVVIENMQKSKISENEKQINVTLGNKIAKKGLLFSDEVYFHNGKSHLMFYKFSLMKTEKTINDVFTNED